MNAKEAADALNQRGGSAFPLHLPDENGNQIFSGMTLRDYFAGQFMTGILANPNLMAMLQSNTEPGEIPIQTAARMAFEASDAMLASGK